MDDQHDDHDWGDLDSMISSYDDNSMAEMEAYESMLAEENQTSTSTSMAIETPAAPTATTLASPSHSAPALPEPTQPFEVAEEAVPAAAAATTTATTTTTTTTHLPEPAFSSPLKRKRPAHINYVLRNPPVDASFQAFTTSQGERMYLRCNKEEEDHKSTSTKEFVGGSAQDKIRIANKMSAMIEKIKRREARRAALEETTASTASTSTSSATTTTSTKPVKARDLWVDKYAPRHFSDLLSPERTNRQVLRWIKSWDPAVFGTEAPPAIKPTSSWGNNSWNKSAAAAAPENKKDPNDRSPPEYKAILICGPPGLGKTTLAHIVAKHAGTFVVVHVFSNSLTMCP